jgi:hypothetical protein
VIFACRVEKMARRAGRAEERAEVDDRNRAGK